MSISEIRSSTNIISTISSIGNTEITNSTLKKSFYPAYSAAGRFLQRLYQLGIIDLKGNLLEGKGEMEMPPLPAKIQQTTRTLLYTQQKVSNHTFVLAPLLNTVQPNTDLEFAGGYVRQQIMSDENYVKEALKILTGEEIELPPELLSEGLRVLPDIDIRSILPLEATEEFLVEKIKSVAKEITKNPAEDGYKNEKLFSKPRVITEPKTHYAIIAIKCLPRPFELIFWSTGRSCLFTTDSSRISVPAPFGKSTITMKHEIGKGWQTLIDLIGKMLRVRNPEQVNHMGFPKMISYFTRSYVCAEKETIPILLKESLKLIPGYYDPYIQLTDFLAKACKSKDRKIAAANICNAFFYLDHLDPEKVEKIWSTLMKNQLLLNTPVFPLLTSLRFASLITACTNGPNHRFAIIEHAEKPAIQLFYESKNCTLLVPFDFEKCFASEIPESLFPIIEEIIFHHPEGKKPTDNPLEIDFEKLNEQTDKLLKSTQISNRYLGFLLLCASKEKSNLLLKLLPEMMKYRNNPGLLHLVSKVYPEYAPMILAYSSERKLEWVQGLIASRDQELIKTATLFWKDHRIKNQDLTVAAALLPHLFEPALSLYNSHLRDNPKEPGEWGFLTSVLERAAHKQDQVKLQVSYPNIYKIVSETILRHDGVGIEEIAFPLKRFIDRLIELEIYEVALQTIELSLPYLPTIKKSWEQWLKAGFVDQGAVSQLAERIKILAASPTPAQETMYWEALKVLTLREVTESLALERLVELKNPKSEQVAQIAHTKMKALFEKGDPASPFEKHYRQLLTPPLLEQNLKRFLEHYLEGNQLTLAFSCWRQLNSSGESLTIRLLDALIIERNLKYAYFIVKKLEHSNERIPYLIKIFDALDTPTIAIVQSLLEHLQTPHREIAVRVSPVLLTYEEIPETLNPALTSSFPSLIETLANEQRFSDADTLISKLGIPLNLGSYYRKALDYSITKNQTHKLFERLEQLHRFLDHDSFLKTLVVASSQMQALSQAKLLLEYPQELQEAMGREKFRELVFATNFKKEIPTETVTSLFERFTPETFVEWKHVLEKAPPEMIAKTWNLFENYYATLPFTEGVAELIEKVVEKMAGKKEWFLSLMQNSRLLERIYEEDPERHGSICLSLIKHLISFPNLQDQLIAIADTIDIEETHVAEKCAEWLIVLIELKKLEKAYPIAIAVINQFNTTLEPLLKPIMSLLDATEPGVTQREERTVIEGYYDFLLDQLKLKLPFKLRLDFAEALLKKGTQYHSQIAAEFLEYVIFTIPKGYEIRFANLYSESFISSLEESKTIDVEVILNKLLIYYKYIEIIPEVGVRWRGFCAKLFAHFVSLPKTTSDDVRKLNINCCAMFFNPEPQRLKEKFYCQWLTTILKTLFTTRVCNKLEWHEVAFESIAQLINDYSNKSSDVFPLIESWIFSVPPTTSFKDHLDNVILLINKNKTFFYQNKGKYLDYLNLLSDIKDVADIKKVINKTLSFKSREAVRFASEIVSSNFSLFKDADDVLVECLTLLFDQIQHYPDIYSDYRTILFQNEDFEKKLEGDSVFAGKIYISLLDNLWMLFEKNNDVKILHLILILLEESYDDKAFLNSNNKLFSHYLDKLIQLAKLKGDDFIISQTKRFL